MRLAALMHRTVAELRETMDAQEWDRWLLFHELYDFPDAFLVAGQLGALISRVVGGKAQPEDFAPYYETDPVATKPDRPARPQNRNDLKPFYGFLAAYAKERETTGRPIPKTRSK